MQRAAQAYIQTRVTTTGQGDILVMLYDGAINFMNMAKERLAANDMAGKGNYITKTLNIIEELKDTLDMDKGGAIAENLRNLYTFCSNRLVMANIKKSPEMIDEVMKVMTGLRSAFAAIVELPEAREAAQQVAAGQRANGILPMRPQAGTTAVAPTPASLAPGSGAKFRGFYAKNQQEIDNRAVPEQAADQPPTTPGVTGAMRPPTASTTTVAAANLSASQPTSADPSPETPPAPTVEREDAFAAFPMPPTGGFGSGRMGGSALYRKMSQQ